MLINNYKIRKKFNLIINFYFYFHLKEAIDNEQNLKQ